MNGHEPGESHRYRIECEVCGERGVVRLSVEPQYATDPDAGPWKCPTCGGLGAHTVMGVESIPDHTFRPPDATPQETP